MGARTFTWMLAFIALASAALTPENGRADSNWSQSSSVWQQMDKCARAAVRAFPDYTREALDKREAFRRKCLRQANLPGGDEPLPATR